MIVFQSGGCLITDWADQAGRHTVARVYATREEKKNLTGHVCIHRPTNGSRRASGRRTARRGVLRRERSYGEAAATAAGERGGYRREAGARAYDIKHYNYYLNSSRMAPGVAAPFSSSFFLAHRTSIVLSFCFCPSRASSSLSRLPSPSPSSSLCHRMAARAFCSRIPVAPRRPILLLFQSRFAPAPPARRRDSLGLVPVSSRPRRERTVATIDPIL